MLMSSKFLLTGIFLITLVSCGGGNDSKNLPTSVNSSSSTSNGTVSLSSAASADISSPLSSIESTSASSASQQSYSSAIVTAKEKLLMDITHLLSQETCDPTQPDTCKKIDVEFTAATLDEKDANQPKVLIIDNNMSTLAFASYRNRVLDLLTTDNDMNLVQNRPKIAIPTTVNAVFNLIKNYEDHLSVQDFASFNNHRNVRLFTLFNPSGGHGYYIAAFLMEHNPTAKFVFVESGLESKLYAPTEACSQLTSADSIESALAINLIKTRYENYLASIKSIIEQHTINFINASWGISRPVLSAIIKNVCDEQASDEVLTKILDIDHQFIKDLASFTYHHKQLNRFQEVALVQAAPSSNRKLEKNDPDFPSDCDSSIINRIRVMDFMHAGTDIPEAGSTDTNFLSSQKLNSKECVDIFIPLGQTRESDPLIGLPSTRPQAMKTIIHGFFEFTVFPLISSPSLAAPVMLSSLINEQSKNQYLLSPPELYNDFLKNNFIHDPILHNQFDVFTWQYRTPSW